jgi:hypothetical protein
VRTHPARMMVGVPQQTEEGARVRMIRMDGTDPDPIPAGTEGTVEFIDDLGTVHVRWDNGRYLGMVPTVDRWRVL